MRPFAEVLTEHPSYRQSLLARWDDCALATKFAFEAGDYASAALARGRVFHLTAAEILRTLKRQGERQMPVAEALVILDEQLLQRDVPEEERVRVPLREIPQLRMAVIKFAADNEFTIDAIVGVEHPLQATVSYPSPDGELIERLVTGRLDVLIAKPPDGAVVIDWKTGWGVPPAHPQGDAGSEDSTHLSYHGYFQQRLYGWLVMRSYPAIKSVTLREFYVYRSEVREATLTRENLDLVERDVARLVVTLDDALTAGLESPLWSPQPGKHCGWCPNPGSCPIPQEARRDGAITSQEQAETFAAEREVAEALKKHRTAALKAWVDLHGPVPVRSAKGRLEVGWVDNATGDGRTFKTYVPTDSNRAA